MDSTIKNQIKNDSSTDTPFPCLSASGHSLSNKEISEWTKPYISA